MSRFKTKTFLKEMIENVIIRTINMSMFLKQEIKYYIINTEVTNNLSLKKGIPCIQYEQSQLSFGELIHLI